jgi:hypothetical protein
MHLVVSAIVLLFVIYVVIPLVVAVAAIGQFLLSIWPVLVLGLVVGIAYGLRTDRGSPVTSHLLSNYDGLGPASVYVSQQSVETSFAPNVGFENRLHRSTAQVPVTLDDVPERGLIIRGERLDAILAGKKSIELRKNHNRQLGPVALIRQGSTAVEGLATIAESVGPLSWTEFETAGSSHQVPAERMREVFEAGNVFGWRLNNVRRLSRPVPYDHPKGAQSRVLLDAKCREEIVRVLNPDC